MAICSTAYSITASFGYLTFGTAVKSDVLLSYDSHDVLVNIARVMISVIVLSTGAMVVFCGRSCLEGLYLAAFRMPPSFAETNESRRRVVQTLVWFTSSLIISVYVKDIQYAVTLIGGLAALFIFFFPGICLVQEMLQYSFLTTTRKLSIVLGLWYVVVGVFIFADSEVFAIMQDIKGNSLY
ncbi:putative sodium-coupled neutral amino acid transporter 7 [Orbicella faveolata]|nr:putative sodium-coupled neutral amino acid transporter 7 [Orbicella faveolata]